MEANSVKVIYPKVEKKVRKYTRRKLEMGRPIDRVMLGSVKSRTWLR